ncbi:Peptidase family M23 [Verrucomicrobium sp. GAS474]|uniref:M23 family metallopeptidase n=1 Tax=Verrucomicrobium sp. GAS474 TaxID=1882831 RepID=UPI00087AEEA1|nr:M23 family metallopeptidase [Verrucomicrobium sp. GAS474]SDU09185.1 Peptidase family M23 [Verrucomicrobium sp. GAS474]
MKQAKFIFLLRLLFLVLWCAGVWGFLAWAGTFPSGSRSTAKAGGPRHLDWNVFFTRNLLHALPIANRFDYPLRPPDGAGAAIGKTFGPAAGNHAGEDWNTAAGDGDLGEPVYSPADGWVSLALDFQSAWGKVVLIDYRLSPGLQPAAVEMMFAHLQRIDVKPQTFVKRGEQIGTVGNADGVYQAHLHWEVRNRLGLGLGGAYSDDLAPWFAPSDFVAAHRGDNRTGAAAATKARRLPPAQWEQWGGD